MTELKLYSYFMLKKVLNYLITALSIIAGIVSSVMILHIYYSGKESDEIYSVSTFSSHAVGFYISLSLFIICIASSVVFHFKCSEKKYMQKSDEEEIYYLLKSKKDLTSLDIESKEKFKKYQNTIIIGYIVLIILTIGLSVFPICYISNSKNFDANSDMIKQTIALCSHSLPFLTIIYILWSMFYLYRLNIRKKQLEIIKTIKNKTPDEKNENKNEKFIVNILRVAVFAIAVSFIIVGIVNKETNDILLKAINICTECIGLG